MHSWSFSNSWTQSLPLISASLKWKHLKAVLNWIAHGPMLAVPKQGQPQFISPFGKMTPLINQNLIAKFQFENIIVNCYLVVPDQYLLDVRYISISPREVLRVCSCWKTPLFRPSSLLWLPFSKLNSKFHNLNKFSPSYKLKGF